MQFVDQVVIEVQSGAGGNGMVAWRREKYVPQGGPSGGDGGNGGSVIIQATNNLSTLMDFKYQSVFKAEEGQNGRNKDMHGKNGKDVVIKVPCGTVVRDIETGNAIADLTQDGDEAMVASGGRGGRGNARFASSSRQAPHFCEPGEPAILRKLELELKLIADVGIIGMPNAGKSTLISALSAAKPKIADYPFTTLVPNLGVVRRDSGDGVVVADIPGLIEGASEGVGLGHEFLRHVERTRVLLHLVDIASDTNALENYQKINVELEKYSKKLAQKPQILVLTKIDALTPEDVETTQAVFEETVGQHTWAISAVSHLGLEELKQAMFELLDTTPKDDAVIDVMPDPKAFDNDDSEFTITRKGKTFYVEGGKIARLFSVTDPTVRSAVHRTMNILKAMGVYAALKKAGAQEGHTINIAGEEFEYLPDEVNR